MKNLELVNAYISKADDIIKGFEFILRHFANNIVKRDNEDNVTPVKIKDISTTRFVSIIKHAVKHNPSLLKDKDYQIRAIELQPNFNIVSNPFNYEIV